MARRQDVVPVRTEAPNTRQGCCGSLRSAILARSIPVIATPRQTGGETLGDAAVAPWVSSGAPHAARGGSTSRGHEEEKGGADDGRRHTDTGGGYPCFFFAAMDF